MNIGKCRRLKQSETSYTLAQKVNTKNEHIKMDAQKMEIQEMDTQLRRHIHKNMHAITHAHIRCTQHKPLYTRIQIIGSDKRTEILSNV